MRIRKYDVNYGRRKLMESVAYGLGGGVLMPLDKLYAKEIDNISKAYPDEMLSIEVQSKGKVKVGDYITKDNVEHVKHLLDPGAIEQITGPKVARFESRRRPPIRATWSPRPTMKRPLPT